MSYTLGQAARATGKSKPTIARAIQSGKLSATRGDDGSYVIEPAELSRVYPVTGNGAGPMKRSVTGDVTGDASEHLLARVTEQAGTISDLRETIRDLRARLDASEDERRRMQTALLTDQREKAAPPTSRWGRFLAWRRGR